MALFPEFPYTNFHELNNAWMLKELKHIIETMEQFVSINSLKYADPIQWDITTQYEKNTIVIEPVSGTAYISVQAVPSGVAISDTDYWTPIFDLSAFILAASQNFANTFEADYTTTATKPTLAGGWIVWNNILYQALTNITPGDAYVIDGNIKQMTVEDFFLILKDDIGILSNLNTTDKSSLVNALNEEITNRTNAVNDEITARTNADATLKGDIGILSNLYTTDKSSLVNALNEEITERANDDATLKGDIGILVNLNTSDKSNLVNAINSERSDRLGAETLLSTRIDRVEEEVANDVYVLIGDSFGNRPNGWINNIIAKFDLTDDVDVFHSAAGGSGFCNPTTFLSQLNTLASNMTDDQKKSVTKVITIGGVNDTYSAYSQATITQAVSSYCERVAELFPRLRTHYIGYNCTFNYPWIAENARKQYQYRTRAGIMDGISFHPDKVAYIAGLDNLLSYNLYVDINDGVHLTATGEQVSNSYIINAINKGLPFINARDVAKNVLHYGFYYDNIIIWTSNGDLYNDTPKNFTGGGYTVLYSGAQDLPYYPYTDIFIPVKAVAIDSNNVNTSIDGIIRLRSNGDISFSSDTTLSNIVRISISGNFFSSIWYN